MQLESSIDKLNSSIHNAIYQMKTKQLPTTRQIGNEQVKLSNGIKIRHTTTLIFATLLAFSLSIEKLLRRLFSGRPRDLPVTLLVEIKDSESSKLLPRTGW